jgi:hypothetical protein
MSNNAFLALLMTTVFTVLGVTGFISALKGRKPVNNRDWLKERIRDLKEATNDADVTRVLVDAYEDGYMRGHEDGWKLRDSDVARLKKLLAESREVVKPQ